MMVQPDIVEVLFLLNAILQYHFNWHVPIYLFVMDSYMYNMTTSGSDGVIQV